MNKEDLEKRIEEVRVQAEYKWSSPETRAEAEARLERLVQLYVDLYGY